MANICRDLHRRCMPLSGWPEIDQRLWSGAISLGNVLGDAGVAANWRSGTLARVIQSYGRFLTFLEVSGRLFPNKSPDQRIDRELVIAYVQFLQRDCAPVTVHGYVLNLERALHAMIPDLDLGWLRRIIGRLGTQTTPSRNKRKRVIAVERLLETGLLMMTRADSEKGLTSEKRAVLFRDGFMVAFLSQRPIRRRSFVGLRIGRQVQRLSNEFVLRLEADDTKNHRPYEAPLPRILTSFLDRYLEVHRPILLGDRTHDFLWVTRSGTPLADSSFYIRLRKVTERELGIPINPHLFRDCAMTSVAIDDPVHIRIMQPLLGHSTMATSEQHYNQATAIDAGRQYQAMIERRRRRRS